MRKAQDVAVTSLRTAVVEQECRAIAAGEILLKGENLPPIAERASREQPKLGERIESDPRRLHPVDRREQ